MLKHYIYVNQVYINIHPQATEKSIRDESEQLFIIIHNKEFVTSKRKRKERYKWQGQISTSSLLMLFLSYSASPHDPFGPSPRLGLALLYGWSLSLWSAASKTFAEAMSAEISSCKVFAVASDLCSSSKLSLYLCFASAKASWTSTRSY